MTVVEYTCGPQECVNIPATLTTRTEETVRMAETNSITKARGNARRTHGMSRTPEHKIWRAIIDRCSNPKSTSYPNYGGRGITVCDRWKQSFACFFADMGERPKGDRYSIERRDNSIGYSPENCCWATPREQGLNTRVNHIVECRGESMPVGAWAARLQINPFLIYNRLRDGWTAEEALFTPVGAYGKRRRRK